MKNLGTRSTKWVFSKTFESKNFLNEKIIKLQIDTSELLTTIKNSRTYQALNDQRGDVPGWVLVVLMTTGLVTAIWTIAAPRLTAILKNSLDSMNGIK